MLIHIIYNSPAEYAGKFDPLDGTMRLIGTNPDGWSKGGEMLLKDLPEDLALVYLSLASAIQSQGADWVATQVWARLVGQDAVFLRVEARQDGTGAIRTFTSADDPSLLVSDPDAVSFFNHFGQDGGEGV